MQRHRQQDPEALFEALRGGGVQDQGEVNVQDQRT